MLYDAAIIGGGTAGLQAALTLSRARRHVLLIDEGEPRHRVAKQMHNLLGADGVDPSEFYGRAHAQLDAYVNCTRVQAQVMQAVATPEGFAITEDNGAEYHARTLLFACGVRDVLPAIEGIESLWGDTVLHCSYCHGYEARDQRIAVLSSATQVQSQLESMLTLSNRLQFFIAGAMPDAALVSRVEALGVTFVAGHPVNVARDAQGLHLSMANGESHAADVMFVTPKNESNMRLPFTLGCADAPGALITVDAWGRANVPGIYAAGDVAKGRTHQFVSAMESGVAAAVSLHVELSRATLG